MKIVGINSVAGGSTGRIMITVAQMVRDAGGEAYTFSEKRQGANAPVGHSYFGNRAENLLHRLYSVTTGISGTGSVFGTRKLLREIDKISPDVIHLHNLHGWYINVPMLFDYIRKNNIKTVWTLHDCWGFTAQCAHFTMEKCYKWTTGCYSCPRYRLYPYTWVDRTRKMWALKKKWLTGLDDLTIVTPSKWLADLASQSYLSEYPIKVINNGIDLDVFKPTPSSFREKYDLNEKKIVLGVASGWTYRKGLDVFIELASRLSEDYQIVLVGTNDKIDELLPDNIISIHRTQNQKELAEIYSAADVFVNPTREENYPTVNMEAVACGTPVVTFDTGGCKEIVGEGCGIVVNENTVDELEQYIYGLTGSSDRSTAKCVEYARRFDKNICYKNYVTIMCEEEE